MDETPQPNDKWGFINAISKLSKTPYGETLIECMEHYGKSNTQDITLEEARAFYKILTQGGTTNGLLHSKRELGQG